MRAAARRILEEDSPGVILLEENALASDGFETREAGQTLGAVAAPLAVHAPVVVIGPAEKRRELASLIEAGAADFVERRTNALAEARGSIQQRLRQAPKEIEKVASAPTRAAKRILGKCCGTN